MRVKWPFGTPVLLSVGVLLACGGQDSEQYSLLFLVASQGKVLEGAEIHANGSRLGVSDPRGSLRVDVSGKEGQKVDIKAVCPSGYRSPDKLAPLMLRKLRDLENRQAVKAIEYAVECIPERLAVALVVRSQGYSGLPVLVQGVERAKLDRSGVAHAKLSFPPNTQFRVVIDTGQVPHVVPQNPTRSFVLGDSDELFIFDQDLTVPKKKARRRKQSNRPKRVPMRIQ